MKKLYLKNLKKHLKSILSATKCTMGHISKNSLSLLNLAISLMILSKMGLIQESLAVLHNNLAHAYTDLGQGIEFDLMLTMQLIQKLFGGEGA